MQWLGREIQNKLIIALSNGPGGDGGGGGYKARGEKTDAGREEKRSTCLVGPSLGVRVRPKGRSAFPWRNPITLSAADMPAGHVAVS